MIEVRKETDSMGVVEVPSDKLWGAQTQRSLEHFSVCKDLIPRICSQATQHCGPTPTTETGRKSQVARGWAELDWSALGLLAAVDAGLGDGR